MTNVRAVYVLTETRAVHCDSDAETRVIGVFETFELASAAKDGHQYFDYIDIFAIELDVLRPFHAAADPVKSIRQLREH